MPVVATLLTLAVGAVVVASTRSDGGNHPTTARCNQTSVTGYEELRVVAGSAQPDQLRQAADVLRKRLSAFGCGGTVSVVGDRLQVGATPPALSHLDQLLAPGSLQFREVVQSLPAGRCPAAPVAVAPEAELTACSADGSEQFRLAGAKVVSSDVKSAKAEMDSSSGAWQVILSFTGDGQHAFTHLTQQLIDKRMAIVLDGKVITAPTIQEAIVGDAQVTGSFTEDSARALASIVQSGMLPVQLTPA